jgi:hypothetical protein
MRRCGEMVCGNLSKVWELYQSVSVLSVGAAVAATAASTVGASPSIAANIRVIYDVCISAPPLPRQEHSRPRLSGLYQCSSRHGE